MIASTQESNDRGGNTMEWMTVLKLAILIAWAAICFGIAFQDI